MKIKYFILFLIGVIYFNACSSASKKPDQLIPIENLVSEFPTQNPTQNILLFDAILGHGEKGIADIINFLGSENKELYQQAKYALNGLASYVADSGIEQDRLLFVAAIHRAIKNTNSANQKIFLIEQLQPCAQNESVESLSYLLKHDKYFNAALRVLTTINSTKSVQEILDNIKDASDAQKIGLINALVQIDQPFVAEELLQWADSENKQLKAATLFALSNFAYQPAHSILKDAPKEDPAYVEYYVNFASGEKQTSLAICLEILNNSESIYSANHQINILKLLTKIDKNKAYDFVVKFANADNLKIRRAALQFALEYKDPQHVQKWIDFVQNKSPERQVEIIDLFAGLSKEETVPYLKDQLNSDSQEVRSASFVALLSFKEEAIFQASKYLSGDLSKEDLQALQSKLLQMDEEAIKKAITSFDKFSNRVKIVFIKTISSKGFADYNPLFLSQLESNDPKLQRAALKALANLGSDDDLKILTTLLVNPSDNLPEKELTSAIVSINNRSKNRALNIKQLLDTYENSSVENKLNLMKVFSGIGHKSFFTLLQKETKNANPDLKDAALRMVAKLL